ncbi:MAG: hypothetical protein AAEJ53_12370, partial [Myxococcota bacterium]
TIPEVPKEPTGEENVAASTTAESVEPVVEAESVEPAAEAGPVEPEPAGPPDLAAGPEAGPGTSDEEPEGGALAGSWERPKDATPAEQEVKLPAWGGTEPVAVGTPVDDVEALVASPLDADVESPIIRPSDPPEEA